MIILISAQILLRVVYIFKQLQSFDALIIGIALLIIFFILLLLVKLGIMSKGILHDAAEIATVMAFFGAIVMFIVQMYVNIPIYGIVSQISTTIEVTDKVKSSETQDGIDCHFPFDLTGETQITFGPGHKQYPYFSPDCKHVVFSVLEQDGEEYGNEDIYIMDLANGLKQENITNTSNLFETTPAYSPDGKKILYTEAPIEGAPMIIGEKAEIIIYDIDNKEKSKVTNLPECDYLHPKFIPTSPLRIVFTTDLDNNCDVNGNWELYSGTLGDDNSVSEIVKLTNRPEYYDRLPSYNPYTKEIIFRSQIISEPSEGPSKLYSVSLDGKTSYQLSEGYDFFFPIVSPSGKWIVFAATINGNQDLYILNMETHKVIKRLTDNPGSDYSSAISPDEKWILVSSKRNDGFFQLFIMPFKP